MADRALGDPAADRARAAARQAMRGPRLQLAFPRHLQERQSALVRDGGLREPLEGARLLRTPQGGETQALRASASPLSLCPGERAEGPPPRWGTKRSGAG